MFILSLVVQGFKLPLLNQADGLMLYHFLSYNSSAVAIPSYVNGMSFSFCLSGKLLFIFQVLAQVYPAEQDAAHDSLPEVTTPTHNHTLPVTKAELGTLILYSHSTHLPFGTYIILQLSFLFQVELFKEQRLLYSFLKSVPRTVPTTYEAHRIYLNECTRKT